MRKFEFCSEEWIALARDYLLGQSEDADLVGLEVAFNEVFTDPPAHLDPDATGKIGWFIRVAPRPRRGRCGCIAKRRPAFVLRLRNGTTRGTQTVDRPALGRLGMGRNALDNGGVAVCPRPRLCHLLDPLRHKLRAWLHVQTHVDNLVLVAGDPIATFSSRILAMIARS